MYQILAAPFGTVLSVILLLSAFSKLKGTIASARNVAQFKEQALSNYLVPLFELFVSMGLWAPQDNVFHLALVLAASIAIYSLMRYGVRPGEACDCFGIGVGEKVSFGLRIAYHISLLGLIISLADVNFQPFRIDEISISMYVVVALLLWIWPSRNDDVKGLSNMAAAKVAVVGKNDIVPDGDTQKVVPKILYGDSMCEDGSLLLIAVTEKCIHCQMIIEDVEALEVAINAKLSRVRLIKNQSSSASATVPPLPAFALRDSVGARGFPFAVVVEAVSGKVVSGPWYGKKDLRDQLFTSVFKNS